MLCVVTACSGVQAGAAQPAFVDLAHLQGEMAGEVTARSVILQSRLTGTALDSLGDVPGRAGQACFEYADNERLEGALRTRWMSAEAATDFIVKVKVGGLHPATQYFYRLIYGPDEEDVRRGPVRAFRTLGGAERSIDSSFVVVSGMNYAFFQAGPKGDGKRQYEGADKHLGFPGAAAILDLDPDFFVGTGDNVYYDHPWEGRATDAPAMRKKWHEQFVQPRFVELFGQVASYWEKDDHDHRYNDNDNTGERAPSSELGIAIFREQLPVVDPADLAALTYRTHRVSRDLQIWLLEGRDYRSPNGAPDGPDKTIWGSNQRAWLQRTLLESDASFKIIITPTPMVGPDGKGKRDNHTNVNGFQHEGASFFAWAKEQGLQERGLYLVCGDRHWQYHSIHPSGFEEFSCGALVDANSRMGVKPGTKNSTDPGGLVQQPYTSLRPSGGFLNVLVKRAREAVPAALLLRYFDEQG
ncbi:MAG: alkaline phosphatase D, partial [Planctomycetota bacterium]